MITRPLVASRNYVPDLLTLTLSSEELLLPLPNIESSHPIEFLPNHGRYVYPAEMRATRDLRRRRCHLVRKRAEL